MSELNHWTVNGITLSGLEAGQGNLVLLLHGFPAYHKTWEHYIQPLSVDFRVIALDLRGYFQSSKPAGVASYSMRSIVQDLVALVAHLGHSTVRLVGHDWGGAIAWAMAAWHPQLVAGAAVYNCPHPDVLGRHLRTNPRQMLRSWYILFFQIPRLPEGLIRAFSKRFIRLAFAARPGTFSPSDLEEYRQAILLPGVLEAAINYYRAAAPDAFRPSPYGSIVCPALLVWGKLDPALGAELVEDMESYFSGEFERHLYPENGHWSVNELAQETLPLLRSFLAREAKPSPLP